MRRFLYWWEQRRALSAAVQIRAHLTAAGYELPKMGKAALAEAVSHQDISGMTMDEANDALAAACWAYGNPARTAGPRR